MLVVRLRAFLASESGATAMEYALLAVLIGVAIVSTFAVLGNGVQGMFDNGAVETITSQTDLIR